MNDSNLPPWRAFRSLWLGLLLQMAAWALASATTFGATPPLEVGAPFLRNFTPKDYGAQAQNWAIVQDARGLIYVGNNRGVLEFDGQNWRLIPVTNGTVVRSLAVDANGRVYVGAVGEVGYLDADADGRTRYVSLLDKLPADARNFGDVWSTVSTDTSIVFFTDQRRMHWSKGKFERWTPTAPFHLAFKVGDRVLATEPGRGLSVLTDKELQLLPGGDRFAKEKIYAVLEGPPAPNLLPTLLIGTRTQGFFLYDGADFKPWPTSVDADLKRDQLYCAARLPDGRLAIGTVHGGLYILDSQGRLSQRIRKSAGLLDTNIRALWSDRDGGLWLGLDKGIARVEMRSSLSRFDDRQDLIGTVLAMHRHKEQLIVGTTEGLFALEPGAEAGFRRYPEMDGQNWSMVSMGDALLAANSKGVFELRGGNAVLVSPFTRSMALLASVHHPGRLIVGLGDGLAIVDRSSNKWLPAIRVQGIPDQIRSIYEDPSGALWLGTYNTGVLRVQLSAVEPGHTAQVQRFSVMDGLPGISGNRVYSIAGEPRFATARGVYLFNTEKTKFEPDVRFTGLFDSPRAVTTLLEIPDGGLWLDAVSADGTATEIGLAMPQSASPARWDATALSALSGYVTQAMYRDRDGTLWLGGAQGLFRYKADARKAERNPYSAFIRQVSHPSGLVRYGGQAKPTPLTLDYADNNLRFEYAAPSFDGTDGNSFQVRLDGNDSDWTDWSKESYRDYGNLAEGTYRFRVRAKDSSGVLSDEAAYDFSVRAPWYRTLWAYASYSVALGVTAWLLLRWRLQRLTAQQRSLAQMVEQRTGELNQAKEAAEQALSHLQTTQAQLVQSEKLASLGQLVAGVAHEVNTPLGVAVTASSLLEDSIQSARRNFENGTLTRTKLLEYLDLTSEGSVLISANLRRAAELVQSFKQVSVDRSSDGRRQFQIRDFLNDLVRSLAPLWKHRAVEVTLNCPENFDVDSFPGALGQIITNLIQNSLLHAFEDDATGHIKISVTKPSGESVALVYSDDGRGIPQDLMGRVFEPFFTTKRNQGGTGLGLHIAFNLAAQKLGGNITVTSSTGEGTSFTIHFPRAAPVGMMSA